jgi:hypothetical protein
MTVASRPVLGQRWLCYGVGDHVDQHAVEHQPQLHDHERSFAEK